MAYCQGRRHGSNRFVGEPLPLRDSSERRPLPNIKQAFDYCAHHPAAVNKDRDATSRNWGEGLQFHQGQTEVVKVNLSIPKQPDSETLGALSLQSGPISRRTAHCKEKIRWKKHWIIYIMMD